MLPIRWELPTGAQALLARELHDVRIGTRVRIDATTAERIGVGLVGITTRIHASRGDLGRVLELLLGALVRLDMWCRRHWQFPSCTRSGLVGFELDELGEQRFRTTAAIFLGGVGQCADLACDRAAELRLAGQLAWPHLVLEHDSAHMRQWHVNVVDHMGYVLEDPARELEGSS